MRIRHLVPVLLLAATAVPAAAQPIRLSLPAFGGDAEIEIRDMNRQRAQQAARAALEELYAVDVLTAAEGGGSLAALNAAGGGVPYNVDPRLGTLLQRAQSFCQWSNGSFGPLAGRLLRTLGAIENGGEVGQVDFQGALESARCDRLQVELERRGNDGNPTTVDDLAAATVTLAEGSEIDLRGWAQGFAVDRALEVLRDHGVTNAWIESGNVRRALGGGPEGRGWPAEVRFPGEDEKVSAFWLRDQAMAASVAPGGDPDADLLTIDQRTGRRGRGVMVVVAVTDLAVDAQALAHSLHVAGMHEGKMRIGALRPVPSVLWLLGDNLANGRPVESAYNWSRLPRIR